MLTWATGTFELEPPDEKSVMEEIQESTEALLMEGMRQLDEIQPDPARPAAARLALGLPTSAHAGAQGAAAVRARHAAARAQLRPIPGVLDRSPRTDLETAQTLLTLIQKDYVTVRH